MAGISDMLVQGAMQSVTQKLPSTNESAQVGVQLAHHIAQVQQQRAELEEKKQKIAQAKDEQVYNMFVAGTKMDPKNQKMFFAPDGPFRRKRDALGKTEEFPDDKLNWITSTPHNLAKARGVIEDYRQGKIDRETMFSTIYNEELYPDLIPYQDQLAEEAHKAGKDYASDKAAMARTIVAGQLAMGKQIQGQKAAPFVQASEDVAKEHTKYTAIGGKAALDKTEAALKKAIADLKEGKVVTGEGFQAIPFVGDSNAGVKYTNKPLQALRNSVLSTQNIKALSGDPNPTQQQIQDINARILDPSADNATNIQVLEAELARVREERAGKEQRFKAEGLMKDIGPKEGDTKEWNGSVYKVIKGQWVKQK